MDCICKKPHRWTSEASLLDVFAAVRAECPVIRDIFVPDDIWPIFRDWHLKPDNEAHHASMLMLALKRGDLGSITSFAHRHLVASGRQMRNQYVKDLREQWMNYNDPLERHHKFKIYFGRIAELQCAEWLETEGWTICDLEAFREGPDIEAVAQNQNPAAFEVKFIGELDECFNNGLKSLRGEDSSTRLSPYGAANFLLFRAYEAAKQLQQSTTNTRIVLLVIDELTWFTFEPQLKNGWIDWKNPAFSQYNDPFIAARRDKNQNLDADLGPALGSINTVWILRRSGVNQYERQYVFPMGPN